MITAEGLALAIVVILFLCGFAGSFLPVLPGTFIVWLGIFIHKIWLGDASVPWTFFWIATALTLLCHVLDPACAYLGAKKFGATWRGALGAVLGGVAGIIFFNLAGLIIAPIVGAILFELQNNRNLKQAGKAGAGAIVGGLAAFALKLVFTCIMIAGFFFYLPNRS